jgi:hypothetical protein
MDRDELKWQYRRDEIMSDLYKEDEPKEEEYCACGCGYLIEFYDGDSFVASELAEDTWIVNDPEHIERYYSKEKREDLLVASKSAK